MIVDDNEIISEFLNNSKQMSLTTDYGHTKAKSLFFAAQIQIPISNKV